MGRVNFVAENLALGQQRAFYSHTAKRPNLRTRARLLWVWRTRESNGWQSDFVTVQPETVGRVALIVVQYVVGKVDVFPYRSIGK